MNNVNINTEKDGNFATFVDSEVAKMTSPKPWENQAQKSGMGTYERVMSSTRRPHFLSGYDIKEGELYPGIISSVEIRNAVNGYPFLRIRIQLNNSSVELTNTRFIDRKKCDSPAEIHAAAMEYLSRFGYSGGQNYGQSVLAEIGSFEPKDKPGQKIKVVKHLFKDMADKQQYDEWLKNKNVRQTLTREPIDLPEL